MNKQRMSNILSSVQMNPKDRKDFIDELSKLCQGGQGGGTGEGSKEIEIFDAKNINEEVFNKIKDLALTNKFLYITNIETFIGPNTVKFQDILVKPIVLDEYNIFLGNTLCSNLEDFLEVDEIVDSNVIGKCFLYQDSIDINIKGKATVYDIYGIHDVYISNNSIVNGPLIHLLDLYNTDSNLPIIEQLGLDNSITVDLSGVRGTYYNGTITAFAEGKIQIYNVNSETGAITLSKSIDLLTLADKLAEL